MKKILFSLFLLAIPFFYGQQVLAQLLLPGDSLGSPEQKAISKSVDNLLQDFFASQYLKYYDQKYSHVRDSNLFDPKTVPDSIYANRLKLLPTTMDMTYNDKVRSFIEFYVNRNRRSVSAMLSLSKYYFPIFEEVLDQNHLPLELKYLAVIESALNPNAVSRAGATGLWQFMYGTGKMYNLEINSLVDERRDPVKASAAAARYLKDLYAIYKDWSLVLAAYNCGPGNVNKAIARSGGKENFWEIYDYLPAETRGYVPAFIAATYFMNYYNEHGIMPPENKFPVITDTVMIHEDLHLQQISEVLDVPIEQLRSLNPQYKNDIIPGNSEAYSLKLPINIIPQFIEMSDSIYQRNSSFFFSQPTHFLNAQQSSSRHTTTKIFHTVRSGETLVKIADKYGVNTSDVKKWNKLKSSKVAVGKKLTIYRQSPLSSANNNSTAVNSTQNKPAADTSSTASGQTVKPEKNKPAVSSKSPKIHVITQGETLSSIARKYDISLSALTSANNLSKDKPIHAGQKLKIPAK